MFKHDSSESLTGQSQPRRFALAMAGAGGGLPGMQQNFGASPYGASPFGQTQGQQGQQGGPQQMLQMLLGMIMGLMEGLMQGQQGQQQQGCQQQQPQQACPCQGNFGQQPGAMAGVNNNGQAFAGANPAAGGLSLAMALTLGGGGGGGNGLGGQNFLG